MVQQKVNTTFRELTAGAVGFAAGYVALTNTAHAGGGGTGSGGGSTSVNVPNTTYGEFRSMAENYGMTVQGNYASRADGSWLSFQPSNSSNSFSTSCPFLAVWNGSEYVHENDFLMGKPTTAFQSEALGRDAYAAGIGGDTYLLSDTVRAEEGSLRVQIREIEPEQSFIDTFALYAVDLKANEHLVVDGDLTQTHVFDMSAVQTVPGQTLHHFVAKRGEMLRANISYDQLVTPADGPETVLETNDELILKIPVSELHACDTYILVDSYFRDWTLGDLVPLSYYDVVRQKSRSFGRAALATVAGVMAYTGVSFFSGNHTGNESSGTPIAYADTPHGGGGGGSSSGSKSLVVTAEVNGESHYLQTIFPRFVRSTQEVVRIPRELIEGADNMITVRIRATKKHVVRAAFVFTGAARAATLQPLRLVRALRTKTGDDVTTQLQEKDGSFVHTTPGDVIDVILADAPHAGADRRRYILKAHGFYTRLPQAAEAAYKKEMYPKLSTADRALLRTLRMRA